MADRANPGRTAPSDGDAAGQSTLLRIDADERARRLAFNQLGERDAERLAALRPILEPHLDEMIAEFYSHLLRFADLEHLLREEPDRKSVV